MLTAKVLTALAALYGLLGVAMGAFAAHSLKSRLDEYALGIIQTATQYQMIHSVAILACIAISRQDQWLPLAATNAAQNSAILFAIGIPLFSGSLYLLALTGQKWLGPITPIGGLMFLAGWLVLIYAAVKIPG